MTTATCTCDRMHLELGGTDPWCVAHNRPGGVGVPRLDHPMGRRTPQPRRRGSDLARALYLSGGVVCLFVAAMLAAGWKP